MQKTANGSTNRLVSVVEAAEQLGLIPKTVRQLIHQGALPAFDLSTSDTSRPNFKIRQDDLDSFLEARRVSVA